VLPIQEERSSSAQGVALASGAFRQNPQFFLPELLDFAARGFNANHRVVWIRLPATAGVVEVFHDADSS